MVGNEDFCPAKRKEMIINNIRWRNVVVCLVTRRMGLDWNWGALLKDLEQIAIGTQVRENNTCGRNLLPAEVDNRELVRRQVPVYLNHFQHFPLNYKNLSSEMLAHLFCQAVIASSVLLAWARFFKP